MVEIPSDRWMCNRIEGGPRGKSPFGGFSLTFQHYFCFGFFFSSLFCRFLSLSLSLSLSLFTPDMFSLLFTLFKTHCIATYVSPKEWTVSLTKPLQRTLQIATDWDCHSKFLGATLKLFLRLLEALGYLCTVLALRFARLSFRCQIGQSCGEPRLRPRSPWSPQFFHLKWRQKRLSHQNPLRVLQKNKMEPTNPNANTYSKIENNQFLTIL